MKTQIKRKISILVTLSLVIGLFYHFSDIQLAEASDAAVEVELQQVSRPNEVETSIAKGLGELVVHGIDTTGKTLTAYSKFSIGERGWVWINNTVNTTYPGNKSSSTLYTNAALTKIITPNYKVHDKLGERLYAYYLDQGTYYLETNLYSYTIGVDLPLKQAVYGYFLPSSQVISVDAETKANTALLHCDSVMSDAAYYWVKDTSTVDQIGNIKNFYTNVSVESDIEVDSNGEYSVCAISQLAEWANYPVDIHVTVSGSSGGGETAPPVQSPEIKDTPKPIETTKPLSTPASTLSYTWVGEYTGWGGPDSYPSSANHAQGSGETCFYWPELTDIITSRGYNCGLELMNPYNPDFTGKENEMAQFLRKMKEPRIKVTLKNGGKASSWNWDTELSFLSGQEMAFPDGYLDNQYFVLFGNDDVITKVEIYDVGNGEISVTPASTNPAPTDTSPSIPTTNLSYTWSGEWTGWGGPDSYPSSANHAQSSGETCFYWPELTDIITSRGYVCGLEFMNPYNPDFTGKENEMAQFLRKMKEPRIKVTLKNGGKASSWNWDTELSFPSGQEVALPDGYLDNQYFILFGNDDVITKVEIYDIYNENSGIIDTPVSPQPTSTDASASPQPESPDTSVSSTPPDTALIPGSNAPVTNQPASGPSVTKQPDTVTEQGEGLPSKPGKPIITVCKSKRRGRVTLKWKKVSENKGYQIQYSKKRSFSSKRVQSAYGKSSTLYGLKSKKTYYIRIRAYKYGNSANNYNRVYGSWSTVRSVWVK